jgi:hypothetical protein
MWRAVEVMRSVDSELRSYQLNHEGKNRLIATHGNRFVLHMIFQSGIDLNDENLDATIELAKSQAATTLSELIEATMSLYETSYPSNLFKNLSKCRELKKYMVDAASIPKNGGQLLIPFS